MNVKKDAEIIQFPKAKIKRIVKVKTPKEYDKEIESKKFEYIDLLVSQYMSTLFARLGEDGVDTTGPFFEKDLLFIGESIISALTRTYGIKHPLQEFVEESFILPGESDKIDDSEMVIGPIEEPWPSPFETLPSDTEPKED